jgi:hypothetical protein
VYLRLCEEIAITGGRLKKRLPWSLEYRSIERRGQTNRLLAGCSALIQNAYGIESRCYTESSTYGSVICSVNLVEIDGYLGITIH